MGAGARRAGFGAVLTLLLAPGCGPVNPGGQGSALPVPADCVAELDGVITAAELPLVTGVEGLYVRSALDGELPFEPAPDDDGDGPIWRFVDTPDDVGATFGLEEPRTGDWFADQLPAEAFLARTAIEDPELRTVWTKGGEGVLAHGLVSRSGGASRTELFYDAPVLALALPLAVGTSWGGQHTFRDARLGGLAQSGVEDWSSEVVARGSVELEGGLVVDDVLVVRTEIDRTLAVHQGDPATVTSIVQQWVAPCAGELARVESADPTLGTVREMRRLVP